MLSSNNHTTLSSSHHRSSNCNPMATTNGKKHVIRTAASHCAPRPCRFGATCFRPNCEATHPATRLEPCRHAYTCWNAKCTLAHSPNRPEPCRFPLTCWNAKCTLVHSPNRPEPCSHPHTCTNANCELGHSWAGASSGGHPSARPLPALTAWVNKALAEAPVETTVSWELGEELTASEAEMTLFHWAMWKASNASTGRGRRKYSNGSLLALAPATATAPAPAVLSGASSLAAPASPSASRGLLFAVAAETEAFILVVLMATLLAL